MSKSTNGRARGEWMYRLLLRAFPRRFRRQYADDMIAFYRDRLEFKVATGLYLDPARLKVIPRSFVVACTKKGVAHRLDHAHPRTRVTELLARQRRLIRPLWVFAHRELYTGRSIGDQKFGCRASVFEFDRRVLPADRVGGTVQKVGRRHTAC